MGKGGGGTQTSTQNNDPWSGQQPFLTFGFDQAQDIYNQQGPDYYPDGTVADLSGTTQLAQNLQTQRALSGNQSTNAGNNLLTNTINGQYLNSNPYLAGNFQAGADQITKAYNTAVQGQTSGMAGGNRLGSGMQAYYKDQENDTLAKNLGNLYNQTYYQDYTNERGNQMNAAAMAPGYAQQDYLDLNALSDVGTAKDTYSQNLINADIDKWNYNQNVASNKLANYMNMIQGNYGGSSTTTSKAGGGSGFGNLLSGAAAVYSMFSDRRLKENIHRIGTAENELPIYVYNYIGDPTPRIGFMADEVKLVRPEAVTTDDSGYDKVDYNLATV